MTNKERKSLGVVFPNTNKENPKSYDLKGTITLPDGKKYRVGAYKAEALRYWKTSSWFNLLLDAPS